MTGLLSSLLPSIISVLFFLLCVFSHAIGPNSNLKYPTTSLPKLAVVLCVSKSENIAEHFFHGHLLNMLKNKSKF